MAMALARWLWQCKGHFVSVACRFRGAAGRSWTGGLVLVLAPIGLKGSEGRYSGLDGDRLAGAILRHYGSISSPDRADIPTSQ